MRRNSPGRGSRGTSTSGTTSTVTRSRSWRWAASAARRAHRAMTTWIELLRLLWGTVVHRPYVWAFFACFIAFALRQLGVRRTLTFAVATWVIAFASEYSSTRNGFPFGRYAYFDATRARELWISNVPFWDSLSFVFLSYFSFVLAAAI